MLYWKANIHEERNGYLKRKQTKTPSNRIRIFLKPHLYIFLESFRFEDENEYEKEIFLILSIARAWASVILAGKRDSRRVAVVETSYQMLQVLSFCDRERAWPRSYKSIIMITVLIFLVILKYDEAFRGTYFLRIREKNLSQISYS